jgi:hypothetical protein
MDQAFLGKPLGYSILLPGKMLGLAELGGNGKKPQVSRLIC